MILKERLEWRASLQNELLQHFSKPLRLLKRQTVTTLFKDF